MTKVVVTGGAGFIGSHLVDALVERGDEVQVIDMFRTVRPDRLNEKATYQRFHGRNEVYDALKGASCVYHLGALPRVQESIEKPVATFEVNVAVTQTMLEMSRECGVKRFVLASSSSVYGNSQKLPLSENDVPEPMSPYAAQKLMSEILCQMYHRTYGMETVCLRYFNVYGPRLDPNGPYALVIGIFLRQWLAGEPLTITDDGTQTRDFTHVSDVVRANILAGTLASVGRGDIINIGAGREVSINALAKMFSDNVQYIPARQEPKRTRANNERALRLLGWQPEVSLEEGIKELQWLALA